MKISLSRLRPLHLTGLTLVYWVGLVTVKLGTALAWAWDVSQLPHNHGTISASLTNTVLHLSIVREGVQVWAGSASLPALAAWIIGPPLLLGLTARWTREAEARADAVGAGGTPGSLGAPPPDWPEWQHHRATTPRTKHHRDDRPHP
jgi:hypothetical protein